ncbi:serine/threonine-protein kinase [Streptomyces odontomachi]|uniref:serine/threonine-protein kinase n=1 Tax=Streptomyces odontomachi TaxID=2944940 RepID=UPI00210C6416|nr:serine/threonine-protein kinase [Streptomyces sp. ODS25]
MQPLDRGDPRAVGPYRILARIGTGGMATVYLGRSRGGRAVAVKVLHAAFADRPGVRDGFRGEVAAARAAGGVHSPPVLDADPEMSPPWMATAFVPAVSLDEAVDRFGPLPAASVRRLAAGLAEALAALHRRGIAHLDVTPANVLLAADGPRLIDFGIATAVRPAEPGSDAEPAGSWGYMSPEQVAGDAGPPSDVYSLGATLEHALDPAGTAGARRDRARPGEDGPDHRSDVDMLRSLVADCRRPDPRSRPTAVELTGRLAAAADDVGRSTAGWLPPQVTAAIGAQAGAADNPPEPLAAPPRRRLLLAGAAAAAVAGTGTLAAFLATGSDDDPPPRPGPSPSATSQGATPAASTAASTPPASPSPSGPPIVVTFEVKGDGSPLSDVAYWVNERMVRLKRAQLPWRKTVEVPRVPGSSVDVRLLFNFPRGEVTYRVTADGRQLVHGTAPQVPAQFRYYPSDVDAGGALSIPGPLPGFAG